MDYMRDSYNRYVQIFKMMRLGEEGHSILSYEEWKDAPKHRSSIMPESLPERSKAQVAGFEAWLAAVRATGLVRAIVNYADGTKWLYMDPRAYRGGALSICNREYKAMVKVLGHHMLRGHDYHSMSFGRRKGKSPIEWIRR